jgi:tRNA A37 threonylcarbamoyladenosine biosynthesis protein TsaE
MKTNISHSLEETQKIATEWLMEVSDRCVKSDEALIVGLSGHLGAGKTAFVKCVAKELGVDGEVTSPTFVLMKIYESGHLSDNDLAVSSIGKRSGDRLDGKKWRRLVHIDAYRLEGEQELQALDFERIVSDPYNLVMIEWPENVGMGRSRFTEFLQFEIVDGNHIITSN